MLTRDPRRLTFATALVIAAFLGVQLAAIVAYALCVGYEQDPSVASPDPDKLGVAVALLLVGLSHVATRGGLRAPRAKMRAALGLAAILAAALEGTFLGHTFSSHCFTDGPWRRSLLDSQIYLAIAWLAAISHVAVAWPRRRQS
jgi:hypothetical protein